MSSLLLINAKNKRNFWVSDSEIQRVSDGKTALEEKVTVRRRRGWELRAEDDGWVVEIMRGEWQTWGRLQEKDEEADNRDDSRHGKADRGFFSHMSYQSGGGGGRREGKVGGKERRLREQEEEGGKGRWGGRKGGWENRRRKERKWIKGREMWGRITHFSSHILFIIDTDIKIFFPICNISKHPSATWDTLDNTAQSNSHKLLPRELGSETGRR